MPSQIAAATRRRLVMHQACVRHIDASGLCNTSMHQACVQHIDASGLCTTDTSMLQACVRHVSAGGLSGRRARWQGKAGCGFFQWCDGAPKPAAAAGAYGGNGGGGNVGGGGGGGGGGEWCVSLLTHTPLLLTKFIVAAGWRPHSIF
jgi:hypothetical protein